MIITEKNDKLDFQKIKNICPIKYKVDENINHRMGNNICKAHSQQNNCI